MQSGYGGVSEIQQFMVDGGCPSSFFPVSTAPPNAASPSAGAEIHHASNKFNPFPNLHHHHQPQPHLQHPHQPPAPPHFDHFGHPIPITQQFFHQFQLFHHQHHHQQHLGMDQESGPETSNSPAGGGPSFLAAMNFKLGVNESGGGGGGGGIGRDGINEDDGILQGDDGSESRLHHHSWHREEESAAANIKEPFWRPLNIDYINPNNKRPAKDKQPAEISSNSKHFKKSTEASLDHHQHQANNTNNSNTAAATTDSNYKLFSELEAIYKPGGTPAANNQTGSGASALTGDDNPLMPTAALPGPAIEHHQPDNISDTSNGGGGRAAPQLVPNKYKRKSKRSKRARHQKQLASTFFELLVKQLMDHQEELHRKFLDVMERRDQERTNREEAWRKQEAAKANREAAARAQERALAAARETAIISFLEKITGESLNLQTKAQFTIESEQKKEHDDNMEGQNVSNCNNNALEPYNADGANNNIASIQLSSSRWPKVEVQALIRVRSGLETRFQEPGLKGPLWEAVSLAMAGMGYKRSAKRCKEKWENINKYFRKTKDSGKKRPQHSKTCPYFHQLDQLYSKSLNTNTTSTSVTPSSSNANVNEERKENSELLDAIVVSNEAGKRSTNAEFNEANNEDEEEEGGDHGGEPRNTRRRAREHQHRSRRPPASL